MKRAERRAHIERLKRKRRTYYGGMHADSPQRLGGLIDTPTPCSCQMCCNPRRSKWGPHLTMQERRAMAGWLDAFRDWLCPEEDEAWVHLQEPS